MADIVLILNLISLVFIGGYAMSVQNMRKNQRKYKISLAEKTPYPDFGAGSEHFLGTVIARSARKGLSASDALTQLFYAMVSASLALLFAVHPQRLIRRDQFRIFIASLVIQVDNKRVVANMLWLYS